ncbi:aminotransferase class V-fold PLP-dependent enzyme [Streptomyces sp. NPDC086783]|uniref:aminotransferase class V-fold PLP-dependent enzyme n=1 Tax=Streptomyces sp. NPDC086783 TaxID=3365758 RepID=UPI00380129EB
MQFEELAELWDVEPGWLNTASYGVPPKVALAALERPLNEWRRGATGWQSWDTAAGRVRNATARLLGTIPENITLGASASQVLAPIAASLPSGSRILIPDVEHTSNVFPWLVHDFDVQFVPPDNLAEAIDKETTAVAFSLVQSAGGAVAMTDKIVAAARSHNALVIVDATQAAGWLPINACLFDAVVVSAYKWLMCPRGTAFGYINPALHNKIRPTAANWYAGEGDASYGPPLRLAKSASRFDIALPWFSYVAAAPTLELILDIGVDLIHQHNLSLANKFRSRIGLPESNSAIVSISGLDSLHRLAKTGIRASARNGGARLAFHIYNTTDDVNAAVEALT